MRLPERPLIRAVLKSPAAILVGGLALSCLGDSAGPGIAKRGQFSLAPSFQTALPPGLVTIDRARVSSVGSPKACGKDRTAVGDGTIRILDCYYCFDNRGKIGIDSSYSYYTSE